MKNKLRFLMRNNQSFIALFVLFVMLFNACSDPSSGSSASVILTPTSFYVDSSGNVAETDSGRTVAVADKKAKVVFYSDNLASSAQRVGFAYEGKTIIFLFENSKNFPTSMVLSEPGGSYKGTFTPYDSATQTYSLTLENGGDSATWSKIALNKGIFTQYKDDSKLTASQNLRMRNLYIAMCIYKSLDDYIASDANRQARGIWTGATKVIRFFYDDPIVDVVVGAIGLYVEGNSFVTTSNPLTMIDNMSGMKEATTLLIKGMNQLFGGGATPGGNTFVAVTVIYDVPTTAPVGSFTLSGTVAPTNATNKTIVWSVKSSGTTGATISGNTLTARAAGTVTVTATIANGKAAGLPYTQDFPITITTASTFVAVTGIYDVPTIASVGSFTLSGAVTPSNATNSAIVWSIKSPGTTGATISGNTLKTTAPGTVTVTATIANGKVVGTPFVQDFSITVTTTSTFVAVTGIYDVPATASVGIPLTLSGSVEPYNATNKTIVWSVKSPGATGATISGNTLKTTAAGSVTVTATIANGKAAGTPYTQDFAITVTTSTSGRTDDGFYWKDNDNGVTITKYDGPGGAVIIPSEIYGKQVTIIGDSAFESCTRLTSVTIPDSVTSIWRCAFESCTRLTSVTIPNSVTLIMDWAFGCCSSLTSVTIPNSVTSIGGWVFALCSSLTAINVDTDNNKFTSENGIVFSKDKTTLFLYPAGKIGSFDIPNSVKYIYASAFCTCAGLTSVTIPNSVISILNNAFRHCTGLTSVTIPDSVTWFGDLAFDDCSSLTSITFKGTIARDRFYGGDNLASDLGDLREKYLAGGIGTYTRPDGYSRTWTKK